MPALNPRVTAGCLDDGQLLALAQGGAGTEAPESHLAVCVICQQRLARARPEVNTQGLTDLLDAANELDRARTVRSILAPNRINPLPNDLSRTSAGTCRNPRCLGRSAATGSRGSLARAGLDRSIWPTTSNCSVSSRSRSRTLTGCLHRKMPLHISPKLAPLPVSIIRISFLCTMSGPAGTAPVLSCRSTLKAPAFRAD